MKRTLTGIAIALACPASLTTAGEVPTITYIEGVANMVDVTPDGDWAVGFDWGGNNGYLWNGQTYWLGPIEDYIFGISDDGQQTVGSVLDESDNKKSAAHWNGSSWDLLPGGESCDAFKSSAWDMTGDGSTAVGMTWSACKTIPTMWVDGVPTYLDQMGIDSARPNAIARNGQLIAGWQQTTQWTACVWRPDGTQVIFDPAQWGEMHGVSANGIYAVGSLSGLEFGPDAIRWSEAHGVEVLGRFPLGSSATRGTAITDCGNQIVGWAGGPLTGGFVAIIWRPSMGWVRLKDYVADLGLAIPDNINLDVALGMTADGTTVVGRALDYDDFSYRGYVLTLPPPPPCPADVDGDSLVGFADVIAVLTNWGGDGPGADIAMPDDVVDFNDLVSLLSNWGPCQ